MDFKKRKIDWKRYSVLCTKRKKERVLTKSEARELAGIVKYIETRWIRFAMISCALLCVGVVAGLFSEIVFKVWATICLILCFPGPENKKLKIVNDPEPEPEEGGDRYCVIDMRGNWSDKRR